MDMLSLEELDLLLALQFSVAWAGEGKCEPARHGWWATAIVDAYDGLDLLGRLAPKTAKWAALQAVRTVAIHVDTRARAQAANPDHVISIFHLGAELDEALLERLAELKLEHDSPAGALPGLIDFEQDWTPQTWQTWCQSHDITSTPFERTPGGRLASTTADVAKDPVALVRQLIGTLHDSPEHYPAPHTLLPS